jgi:hypothetical protein
MDSAAVLVDEVANFSTAGWSQEPHFQYPLDYLSEYLAAVAFEVVDSSLLPADVLGWESIWPVVCGLPAPAVVVLASGLPW